MQDPMRSDKVYSKQDKTVDYMPQYLCITNKR